MREIVINQHSTYKYPCKLVHIFKNQTKKYGTPCTKILIEKIGLREIVINQPSTIPYKNKIPKKTIYLSQNNKRDLQRLTCHMENQGKWRHKNQLNSNPHASQWILDRNTSLLKTKIQHWVTSTSSTTPIKYKPPLYKSKPSILLMPVLIMGINKLREKKNSNGIQEIMNTIIFLEFYSFISQQNSRYTSMDGRKSYQQQGIYKSYSEQMCL